MRVLFVDDEPNILSGIRRMMRSMRSEWEMDFVESGMDAVEKIEASSYDVVVSDMRMPGMDGAQLLSLVKEKCPDAIRIALSGQTEPSMIYRCVQNAHQYLAKPCDSELLVNTVRRASLLQELLKDHELANHVKEMSSIPSLPEQYERIMQELQSEDASMRKVGEIVESDVAMTAKILQMVNSAFFGLSQHVSSPAEGAMLLGVDVIRTLVLTSGVISQFDSDVSEKMHLQSVWFKSAQVGALAKKIAMQETGDKFIADYAYMAGMMMDIGMFVLASNLTDELATAWLSAQSSGRPGWEIERELFGQGHMEIGAYLVGLWGLPNPIVEALAYHHRPSEYVCDQFSALTAVHVALAIVEADGAAEMTDLDTAYLEKLDLMDRLDTWRQVFLDSASGSEE